ncbi:MAG: hypothetical protein C4536_03000 [Actinobacteria bacterium]|nr:MAG: hypothetical protein C4536_03000 [Actinomycetota bacterium]
MQTTEKIVQSYCNYVLGLATIPNVKCDSGQYEIDILAVDPKIYGKEGRFHIECSIHITSGFSKITAIEFSEEKLKERVQKPKQRMSIGFFIERKFDVPEVLAKLKQYGFKKGQYRKVIVADGWTEEAEAIAKKRGILLWDFNQIVMALAKECEKSSKYFDDDALRTIQLLLRAQRKKEKETS